MSAESTITLSSVGARPSAPVGLLSQQPQQTTFTSRKGYQEYLSSPDWKRTRAHWKARAYRRRKQHQGKVICKLCFAFGPIELHHLTYRNVGHEKHTDLIGLCPECHEFVHTIIKVDRKLIGKLPRLFHRARQKWLDRANAKKLWYLRKSDPAKWKQMALDYIGQFIKLRSRQLRREIPKRNILLKHPEPN